MIIDLAIGGILIPGLLALALIALVTTVLVLRLLSACGIHRVFAHRPLVELAVFAIVLGLLAQHLTGMSP
ncbi:hypothetical protein MAUB1S_08490 [Mycolicibacterium aubagnense]